MIPLPPTAFVTGATGLLGNNLVRALVGRGVRVKALARSRQKAAGQLAGLAGVEVVEGDLANVAGFAPHLAGCGALFHAAAYFRESFQGGRHWKQLHAVNVAGTARLLAAAHAAGIRRAVHTSSVAVLRGAPGQVIDETMRRPDDEPDDYFRSKILSDRVVSEFLSSHPDMFVTLVLPGWMFGPGDVGPTSAGQLVLDFVRGKLPGRVPGSFSVVDARDVAGLHVAALERGRRGEAYLAAGRHLTMDDLFPLLEEVSGVSAPTRRIPLVLLRALAAGSEFYATLTRKPVLLSRATVNLMAREADRTRFDPAKSARELGGSMSGKLFRPVRATLADTVDWYRAHGWLPPASPLPTAGGPTASARPAHPNGAAV